MAKESPHRSDLPDLAALVAHTPLLDAVLRQKWLSLLPGMSLEQQLNLWQILTEGERQLTQADKQLAD
jgi:hypothetical protein